MKNIVYNLSCTCTKGWTKAHAQHEDFLALVGKGMAERMQKVSMDYTMIMMYLHF